MKGKKERRNVKMASIWKLTWGVDMHTGGPYTDAGIQLSGQNMISD